MNTDDSKFRTSVDAIARELIRKERYDERQPDLKIEVWLSEIGYQATISSDIEGAPETICRDYADDREISTTLASLKSAFIELLEKLANSDRTEVEDRTFLWDKYFYAREVREIEYCRMYDKDEGSGLHHIHRVIIARMARMVRHLIVASPARAVAILKDEETHE